MLYLYHIYVIFRLILIIFLGRILSNSDYNIYYMYPYNLYKGFYILNILTFYLKLGLRQENKL